MGAIASGIYFSQFQSRRTYHARGWNRDLERASRLAAEDARHSKGDQRTHSVRAKRAGKT
jgi:hypothetical protein